LAASARQRQILAVAILAGWSVFACCAQQTFARNAPQSQDKAATANPPAQSASNKRAMKFVVDETGRHVAIPLDVRRVVSLAPSITEAIYALGLESKLAGDTTLCDIPTAAKEKPHVGAPVNPSLEAIVAMHPDLVLASASINRLETVEALEKLGIPVYSDDPHTVRGILTSTEVLADLLGAGEQGAAMVANLQAKLDALHAALQELPLVHVLFVVWEDPIISISQNTFIADALRWAGAESVITANQNWPQVSMEEVVRLQPEYIVLTEDHLQAETGKQIDDLRARPTWRNLQAVKLGHVVVTSGEVTRPSPGLVDVIETLAHQLHPSAFPGKDENGKLKIQNGLSRESLADVKQATKATAQNMPLREFACAPSWSAEAIACAR
jgi:iron complex transport system substrate-binding protein